MHTPEKLPLKIIGVGNEWRGDDAAGLLVARRFRAEPQPGVQVSECRGEMSDIREALKAAAGVILVDAMAGGGPPGTIQRFDWHAEGLPPGRSLSPSSHGWGVAEALALGKIFQELPPFLIIYGIEGEHFGPGQSISLAVAAAVPEAARRIQQEIHGWWKRQAGGIGGRSS
jgi:hydrogenase maturation protease